MSEKRDPLHERMLDAIERYRLLEGAGSVLVGVSGGQDSLALLHSLVVVDEIDVRVGAIHVHHGMRGAQADADADAVRELCEALGVTCHVARSDVPGESARSGLNAEQAGRVARYREYSSAMRQQGFDRVATGHTGTDRAETLLLNLFRGAGLDGLASIPPVRGRVIRPLILATREETGDYCLRHGLSIRTDCSNLDPDYARRNMIRLRLMPEVERVFPGAEQALLRACEAVEEELAWTDPLLRRLLEEATLDADKERLTLSAEVLAGQEPGALHRLLRMAIEAVRGDLDGVSREHIERMAELLRGGRTGAVVQAPGGLRARCGYDTLVLEPDEPCEAPPDEEAQLPVPGEARLPCRGVTVRAERATAPESFAAGGPLTACIAPEAAQRGLVLRSHQPGERFVPLGMTGSRKLQDFFVDKKVPRHERDRIPVVADPDGVILWVVGQRLSEEARADAGGDVVRLTAVFEAPARDEEDA